MPSSSPAFITEVVTVTDQILPRRILDIGFGWGKYGLLMREYLQGKVDDLYIVGVEPFKPYLELRSHHQDLLYDEIMVEKIEDVVDKIGKFDLILFMDVIEHLPKDVGTEVLTKLLRKCKFLFVSTPKGFHKQGAECGNELETHLSGWVEDDFSTFEVIKIWGNDVAFLLLIKGTIV